MTPAAQLLADQRKYLRIGAPDIDAKQAEVRRTRKQPVFVGVPRLK